MIINQVVMSEDSLQFRFMRYLNEMDFVSQQKADRFYRIFIPLVTIISYLIATVCQQFSICVWSTLGAMAVAFIIVGPGQAPWWKHPLPKFQPDSLHQKPKEQ